MFRKLPFILILTILISVFFNNIIPLQAKQIIYAISLTIKSVIMFLLPFVIFGLLFKTFVKLSDNAVTVIVLVFGGVCISNFFNTFNTQFLGSLLYRLDFNMGEKIEVANPLLPAFSLELPQLIETGWALLGGIICGILISLINRPLAEKLAKKADFIIAKMFLLISALIPMFIFGFVVKCTSENILMNLIRSYFVVFVMCVCYMALYVMVIYVLVNRGVLSKSFEMLKNMCPAFLTALSTMSSGATMPVTIMCAEKNVKHKDLAASTVSSTVNIHLLGDCIAIPFLAYAVLKCNGCPEPAFAQYCVFALFFTAAKFSVAAVPAGGIIVMTPILDRYLGLSSEMSSLIIALYVIWDPIITSVNVLGNGAFAKLIDQLYDKFVYRKKSA